MPNGTNQKVVSLNTIVMAARESLRPETVNRNIVWRPVELGEAVCDPEVMQQVFVNLLSNAIRYTRKCSPAVIQVGAFFLKGEQVVFVRDNGSGFDKRRDENAATRTGVAATIIRRQGGKTWANADIASGATVYFTVRTPGPIECTVSHGPAGL
jgi:light-regulated signal transduction histidine kinase (bacteriophytochrome)